jgi:hypothetical protein
VFDIERVWIQENWKKVLATAASFLVSFVVLHYAIPLLFGIEIVPLLGAIAVAYYVYTRVSLAEIEALIKRKNNGR